MMMSAKWSVKAMSKEFLNYANSFQATARLRLESITDLLERLGNPHLALKCVHIAGTNGKGSVCAFLSSMLTAAGYRTGKYISPNMVRVNERISIDGTEITDAELESIMDEVKSAAEKTKERFGEYPTQFELWTAAAFLYFLRKKCDICVIEVGLGGERDATNVIEKPLLSVITSISFDHMGYLGNTLGEIARCKAGIIKDGCPLVTFRQCDEVMSVFQEVCTERHSQMYLAETPTVHTPSDGHEIIDCGGMKGLKLGIRGVYQCENAALAIEAARLLKVDKDSVRRGLESAANPGRFEVIKGESGRRGTLIIDGAHNESGMQSLMRSLERYFPGATPVFIMAMMADKEKSGVIKAMRESPCTPEKIFTVTVKDNSRAMSPEALAECMSVGGFETVPCCDIGDALEKTKDFPLCVICGSLYLYKDYTECVQ